MLKRTKQFLNINRQFLTQKLQYKEYKLLYCSTLKYFSSKLFIIL